MWSPLGYAVIFEVYSHTRQLLSSLERSPSLSNQTTPAILEIRASSEYRTELEFQLPGNHTMKWYSPSVHFERSSEKILLTAPTFLLELDSHILMNLESPSFERQELSALMDLARQDFKKRINRTNRVWTWSAQSMEVIFPYKVSQLTIFTVVVYVYSFYVI